MKKLLSAAAISMTLASAAPAHAGFWDSLRSVLSGPHRSPGWTSGGFRVDGYGNIVAYSPGMANIRRSYPSGYYPRAVGNHSFNNYPGQHPYGCLGSGCND